MEYLCILKNLNAFDQNYYNRITQIERNSTSETTTPTTTPPPASLSSSAPAASASDSTLPKSSSQTSGGIPTSLSPKQTSDNMYDPPTGSTGAMAPSLLQKSFNAATPSPPPPPASSSSSLLPQAPALITATPTALSNALAMSNRKTFSSVGGSDVSGGSFSLMPSLAAAAHQHLLILQRQQQEQQLQQLQNEHQYYQQQQQLLAQQRQQSHEAVTPSTSPSSSNFHHQQQQQNDSSAVNSLLWQPWRDLQQAAAIHHQLYQKHQEQLQQKEERHSSKELPTIKWRRERRQLIAEYRAHDSSGRTTPLNQIDSPMDSPIDMSVSSSSSRYKSSPPPYREPLPGSSCYTTTRPSVITQAPRKRDLEDNLMISKREKNDLTSESISMCENVIDEHFRRSLGANYAVLFGKKSPTPNRSAPSTPSPQPMVGGTALPTYAAATSSASLTIPAAAKSPVAAHQQHHHYNVKHIETKYVQPKSTSSSPNCCELPPPQDEPLSLHREPIPIPTTPTPTPTTPTPQSSSSPHNNTIVELPLAKIDVSQHPPTPSTVNSGTPTTIMPPDIIKSEPGLTDSANTPPSSPTSFSTASSDLSNVLASVDDHFAKALGDTWKKLQEHK